MKKKLIIPDFSLTRKYFFADDNKNDYAAFKFTFNFFCRNAFHWWLLKHLHVLSNPVVALT